MKLAWTIRPALGEAECPVALVNYRFAGTGAVVWRIKPKIDDVDERWAAATAQDAASVIDAQMHERAKLNSSGWRAPVEPLDH
jgi:hypothetical protein